MAAQQSGLPMLRTSRFFAEARDARQASLVQEAGAACRLRCTPPHAAEASRSHGCRKQPRVARRASTVGWPRNATSTPFGWLGVTRHDQQMVSAQGGLLPKSVSGPEGCRRCPMRGEWVAGSRWRTTCHRTPVGLVAVTSHDRAPKKAGQNLDGSGCGRLFFWERNPVKTFPMWNVIGVFLAVPNSITKPLANTTSTAWRRGCAIEARPAQARSVCTPAVPQGIAKAAAARRPRERFTTVAHAPRRTRPAQRFDSHQRRSGLARTRRARLVAWPWMPRPVFRLVGREDSRPGSAKPAKAEPMKDEIRLWWKRNPVKTFPMKDGIEVFSAVLVYYIKTVRKTRRGVQMGNSVPGMAD